MDAGFNKIVRMRFGKSNFKGIEYMKLKELEEWCKTSSIFIEASKS